MPAAEWDLYFVLPNLNLVEGNADPSTLALAPEYVAVVPADDPRVTEITTSSAAARVLVNGFHNSNGEQVTPAVMIVHRDAPAAVRERPEAIFAFRNAIALSHILRTRTRSSGWSGGAAWADTFDVHPTTVSKDGTRLITDSPAVSGVWLDPEHYSATSSDGLPSGVITRLPDDFLFSAFQASWMDRFIRFPDRDVRRTRVLFRSLELAYEACLVRGRHYGSLYEHGTTIAVWVSAIEVLAAPAPTRRKHPLQPGEKRRAKQTRNVEVHDVVSLLDSYQWQESWLREKRYHWSKKKEKVRVNLIQRLYTHMYNARSRFLHGDTVSPRSLYLGGTNNLPLPQFAPHVYWTALRAYLQRDYDLPPPIGWAAETAVEKSLLELFNRSGYIRRTR